MNAIVTGIVFPLCAYVLGSIPFGLLLVRTRSGRDIRHMGSGNIGATNVKRALGSKWAAVTLLCDGLKGALPTLLALLTAGGDTWMWLPAATALAAIIGHIYPIFLKFEPSGKGVATTLGCLLVLAPLACILSLMGFILAVYVARRVSVGSLTANFILPIAAWFTTHDPAVCMASIIIMVLVLMRHKENIQRLTRGTEPKIDFSWRSP